MRHLLTAITLLLTLVLTLVCCTGEADRSRMRAGLDSLNQRNRNDLPFTAADVQPYADYFDRRGTANDRLLAHYLLGRAYYEAGEAPMALQCYQQAAECADTTAKDCDYKQLCRVYAQMAEIFYYQGLNQEQLKYEKLSVKYAWQAKDTLAALMNYEQESFAYDNLGFPDSAIIVIEDVARRYQEYGYSREAAISLGTIVSTFTNRKEYQKAKQCIDRYENESGLFDSIGNIAKGREIYYKVKGYYYKGIGNNDSAEYWFRKELHDGKDYNNQNAGALGLAVIFEERNMPDSMAKYYRYAYAMNDSMHARQAIRTIERMTAMYDYSRHQEKAQKESQKAIETNRRFWFAFSILLIALLLVCWLYIARNKIIENLERTVRELNTVRSKYESLLIDKTANQKLIAEMEARINYLKKKLGKYGKLVYFGSNKAEHDVRISPTYQKINEMRAKGQIIPEEEWLSIQNLMSEYFPGFKDYITSKMTVESTEYRICQLLRLHFRTSEVANMLGVTSPYISKISSEILRKTFGKKGSTKELAKELSRLF